MNFRPLHDPPASPAPAHDLESRTHPGRHDAPRGDEFPAGAAEWPAELNRRDFVRLMGASVALAGVSGCARRTLDKIVPSVISPESVPLAAGEILSFATAMPFEGYARGILVTAHDGRPTKIEGNPDHPESLGATDVFTQAAILSLYDPDRSPVPQHAGQPADWQAFVADWLVQRSGLHERRGAGLVLLTEPTTSPTLLREIHGLLDAFPAAQWFQHTPLARYDHRGVQEDYDFAGAAVILTVESDCFYRHPAAVRYGRALAARRRVTGGQCAAPRFYALEASPSVTGALADFRLPASPNRARAVLDAVAQALGGNRNVTGLAVAEERFVRALVADVQSHAGQVACVAGPECDADIRDWAAVFNRRFGQAVVKNSPVHRSDADPRAAGDLAAMAATLDRGEIRVVCMLGCNPVYTAPADLDLVSKLRRVPFTMHLGEYFDETAAVANWHLPEAHFLETWSDLRAYGGAASVQQPLITPLHDSRSAAEVLRLLYAAAPASAYDLVRETWRSLSAADDFETRWEAWLSRGLVDVGVPAPAPAAVPEEFPSLAKKNEPAAIAVIFQPDPSVLDGRYANNAWLQELPKPLTHLVWGNAALVSPQLAAELRLTNGDVVACEAADQVLEVPVWIMAGQAPATIALSLGYGRTHAGIVGNGLGYDAYRFRDSASPWQREGVVVRKRGTRRALVSTHDHFAMEGRDLVRVVTPVQAARPRAPLPAQPSLYPAWRQDRYAWGMSIDLGTCLGCNACIIACQAENNIPVVGAEQVARFREMHWIRVDRYLSGKPENPRFLQQPVPCMQCENAPCELVCPVAATVHSSEGLNDMVYNRCVGTRYCSNNCPYKVRRFNFFDYRAARSSPVHLQENPNVTVRERGVMEKCTYCVQRINAARIAAEKEDRAIRDGEVRTACQQACPAEAIVFGDLNDPSSRVSRRKTEPINYALLEELNTRPRTTYLAAVRHPPLS